MNNTCDEIQDWMQQVQEHRAAGWDSLPEVYLYTGQVVSYMERQLHLSERSDESVLLTPSMISSYVKDQVLPHPDEKKYSREHPAMLTVVCLLEQALSIQDISSVPDYGSGEDYQKKVYESFRIVQERKLAGVCEQVGQAARQGEEELRTLACASTVEASARRITAKQILSKFPRLKEEMEERPS